MRTSAFLKSLITATAPTNAVFFFFGNRLLNQSIYTDTHVTLESCVPVKPCISCSIDVAVKATTCYNAVRRLK